MRFSQNEVVQNKAKEIIVALAGNPNVGKTTVFNALTGSHQHIGNWPGVTVEKKEGYFEHGENTIRVIDLPGVYGLTAYSIDELIARNFIVEENPDIIIDIVNASNLERNLYLTISLLEMNVKVIIVLNMMDLAENLGYKIDHEKLSKILGVPVIPTIAIRKVGIGKLIEAIKLAINNKLHFKPLIIDYGPEVEEAINSIISVLHSEIKEKTKYDLRWLAIKLLEGDEHIIKEVKRLCISSKALDLAVDYRGKLRSKLGKDVEDYLIERRYQLISNILNEVLSIEKHVRLTFTDIIDAALLHRVVGIPIALSALYLVFRFAFEASLPLADLIDWFFGTFLYDIIYSSNLPSLLKSFLADGLITGLGTVLVFLPVIVFFFITLAILEDIGYMARVAYLVDKVMHKFGLTGRSIIPLIIGFGCNIPGVIATRTIMDENDRKVTALVAPLISCSARLPVYLVLAGALFLTYMGTVVLSMYIWSIILTLLVALILRKFVFKGISTGFIMELPEYTRPLLSSVLIKTWERTKRFLFKAGTVILIGIILIWLLSITGPSGYIGPQVFSDPALLENSWIGVIGHTLSFIFAPMNWGWRASAALLFGFVAKEIVVGSMALLFGVGEEQLSDVIVKQFTPLSAYAYMAFVLLYVPCIATLAAIRGELGLKYAIIAAIYELFLAYIVALSITLFGQFIGLG